jgi:hypothetical protein
MTTYYRISGTRRIPYSIDEVTTQGQFSHQVAFFFRTYDHAHKRLLEIIQEDALAGRDSEEYQPQRKAQPQ